MQLEVTSPSRWVKSRRCHANNTCVEIAQLSDRRILVRDAGHPGRHVLVFGPAEWRRFAADVRAGRFDL